ncbi:UNVERIFIED_ORG: conjugal transfer pilin signal peptidase TrbI [Citrobacter freundii]
MDTTDTLTPPDDTTVNPPKKRSGRRNRCLKPVVCVVAGMVMLNAAIALLLTEWRQPKIVSFDMAGTVNSFMAQAATQSLDESQIKTLTARFNTALSDSLTTYQHEHRALIIVAPAVVGGAEDITPVVQQTIAEKMAEGK